MEEILHQLVTIGNYKTLSVMGLQWDKPYTNWCRISSIHSMNTFLFVEVGKLYDKNQQYVCMIVHAYYV